MKPVFETHYDQSAPETSAPAKTTIQFVWRGCLLLATGLALLSTAATQAALTSLVQFSGDDGGFPAGDLVQDGSGNFYGMTSGGGNNGQGTIFKRTSSGNQTVLVHFAGPNGSNPYGNLVVATNGDFYGMTLNGGANNLGTIFRMTSGGTLTTLVHLSGSLGSHPNASLVQGDDGDLYGLTSDGGIHSKGTIFKMTHAGVPTKLVDFSGANGSYPYGSLVKGVDGNFYGMTSAGGVNNRGIIFKLTSSGSLTKLVDFNGANGSYPYGSLVRSGNGDFYGMTSEGGAFQKGTAFRVTPAGDLTKLLDFDGANGSLPYNGLMEGMDGHLYGMTSEGGANGLGTVFQMTREGTLTTLVHFNYANGSNPYGNLIQGIDGDLYGMTLDGANFFGTLFRLDAPPVPEIGVEQPEGTDLASGSTIDFGYLNTGDNLVKIVTITNSGSANLTGLVVNKTGTEAADFTIGNLGSTSLAPNENTSFTVTFAPVVSGSRNALLRIHSNDGNENPFEINLTGSALAAPFVPSQSFSLNENSQNGAVVGQVLASDPDVGQSLTYAITNGNPGEAFAIDAVTGQLTVNNAAMLDFETTPSFTLSVQVTDSGIPATTASGLITVSLINVVGNESTRPTLTVAAPIAFPRVVGIVGSGSGKAGDASGLELVVYQLNGGFWRTANGTTNWTATLELTPGTNTIVVKSLDRADNYSLPITRKLFSAVSLPVTININGGGSSSIANGTLLDIGRNYTVLATAAPGNLFSNWTGTASSSVRTVTFRMATNCTLNANFVPNYFPAVSYAYKGLFHENDEVRFGRSGSIALTLTKYRSFSGSLVLAGQAISFSGYFKLDGTAVVNKAGLTISLQLDVQGSTVDMLRGTVAGAGWTAEITADRQKAGPYPQAGKYSLVLASSSDGSTSPGGSAIGSANVDAAGGLIFSLTLPDNTSFRRTSRITTAGLWPLYLTTHGGLGSMLGWLSISNLVTNSISGEAIWIKSGGGGAHYPAGFTNELTALGSTYNYTAGSRLMRITNGLAISSGGNMTPARTNFVLVADNNLIKTGMTNGLQLSVLLNNGFVSGSITNQAGVKLTIKAAPLPQHNVLQGFIFGPSQSGSFLLQSND